MRLGRVLLTTLLACLIGPTAGTGQEPPIFDAHLHYNQADWAVYSPEAILAILDAANVRWALVSSTPDEGTLRLHQKAADRMVPVLRPYRTDADRLTWTVDPAILAGLRDRLRRGIYRGIGEFHLTAAQAGDPVVRGLAELARQQGLFLYAHTDTAGIAALAARYPDLRLLWAHAGLGEPLGTVAETMGRHPRLLAELSLKSEVAPEGRLDPGWRALLLRHPDRFLVGTDTYVTSQWARLPALQAWTRAWLAQLPREAAARLAHGNARALLGLP